MCQRRSTAAGRKQHRRGRGKENKSKMPIMNNSFSSYCDTMNNPTEQRNYKNTFGHLTNSLLVCRALSDMLLEALCALRPPDRVSPVDMEKSVTFTSFSKMLKITHDRPTHSSSSHTHIFTLILSRLQQQLQY